ncbi:MAG: ATP-binding cassette domain-containing protein [Chloroflexota bacterium]
MADVVSAQNLVKRYGETIAVHDVSFSVQQGEIFVIVGPNGAGKTTTVEMLAGLRRPDAGQVRLLGLDPQQDEAELRRRTGIQLQQAALPHRLKVWEALDLFASFYPQTVPLQPLMGAWGLTEKRNTAFTNLSGGQQQRLFIALALINDPELVFLDEITTGLDPQARRATWDAIRDIRRQGKAVVLVTHFMDEAQALGDRVAIVDHGRVVALDTPRALIAGLQAGARVCFTNPNGFDPTLLQNLEGVVTVEQHGRQVVVLGEGPLLARVSSALLQRGIEPADLDVQQPTLEDVFLAHTGRQIRN